MSKIVVVDDSYAELQVIEGVLKGANHTVVSFPNTEKLEDKVVSEKPDLIVMDIDLPNRDGVTATKLIHNCVPGTRVLLLSSHDDDARIVDAVEAAIGARFMRAEGVMHVAQPPAVAM